MSRTLRFHATDLITPFHLASALGAALRVQESDDFVDMHAEVIPNLHGAFLLAEGEDKQEGISLRVVPQLERSGGVSRKLQILVKTLLILIGRLLRLQKRIWLAHHTYFKPTMLDSVTCRDALHCGVVAFDEGLGTYAPMAAHRRGGRIFSVRFGAAKFVLRKSLRSRLFVDLLYRPLIAATDAELLRDAYAVLAGVFEAHAADWPEAGDDRPRALLIGCPLIETHLCDEDQYIQTLRRVAQLWPEHEWFALPHPLELSSSRYSRSGMAPLEVRLPGELVVERLAPQLVVGFGSTLLVTASRLEGIQCVDASRLLPSGVAEFFIDTTKYGPLYEAVVVLERGASSR